MSDFYELADQNDPEWQRRYDWLLNHIATCTECDLVPHGRDGHACADLHAHFSSAGAPVRADLERLDGSGM